MTTQRISQKQAAGRKTQYGYVQGLTIIIVVLAIIGFGILLIGMNKLTGSKVQNEIQYITDLMGNTRSYASQIGVFDSTNANLQALVGRGFFPPNQVSGAVGSRVVTNQWKGAMEVAVGTISVAGDALEFTSPGYPESACKQVATQIDSLVSRIRINGTTVKAVGAKTVPADVDAACSGNTNTLIYTVSAA